MKVNQVILYGLAVLLLLRQIDCQYAYTQISENLEFDKTTAQVRQDVNLGEEFRFSKQYSIWGWFRYIDGDQPSIMNILNLHNDQEISNNSAVIGPFPNPDYPECPYTSEQIKNIPNLVNMNEVKKNPNCFPQKIDSIDEYDDKLKTKKQDILYLNFDLIPANNGQYSFNLTVLFQNGQKSGQSDMKIIGFNDIPWLGQFWGFFALSFDYQRGQSTIYFKIYDNSFNNSQIKTFQLDYDQFLLQNNSTLTIASVENNNYFSQVTGFTGNIAYIEMSAYYTNQLNTLWTGYMSSLAFEYHGVIINIEFDMYSKDNSVTSNGALDETYKLNEDFQSLFVINKNMLGVRFLQNSSIDFGSVDLKNIDLLKAIVFYFKLLYHERLPDNYTLIQRGIQNENGYLKISLVKNQNGRFIMLEVQGDENTQKVEWKSQVTFQEDRQIIFQIGIAQAPSGAVRVIYVDQFDNQSYELLSDNMNFNMDAKQITLLKNPNNTSQNGYIDMYNFKILNSASSAEFVHQIQNALEKSKFQFYDDCLFRSSYYKQSKCFDCRTKVLSNDGFCTDFCLEQFKNPLEQICKPCTEYNCNEIDKTTWYIERIDPGVYRFRPTRKLIGGFPYQIDNINGTSGQNNYIENINIKFQEELQSNGIYDYIIVDQYINREEQYIDYEFQFRDTILDKNLQFIVNKDVNNPQYDINRNLIFHNDKQIVKEITLNTVKEGLCYVRTNKRRALKALAITAMTVFYLSVLVLLIVTIACSKRIYNLGALWKFLLHNWMKIQLIAFLLFIAIYMPCCVKEFLRWIYILAVSWNHALGKPINDINDDNDSFNRGMLEARPPRIFYNERIEVFYLHNFGVFFIIQGFFFLLYIILKIWDLLATSSANCLYRVFVFIEYSGLIALFLMTAMQTFVFAALNWRYAVFYHSYFVMCFLIAIAYIAVFAIFWIYSLIKLISAEYVFQDQIIRNKYYYFFCGYKNQKWSRTWDHWMVFCHFIIGLMIGLLVYHQLSQMIIITSFLVLLFAITVILRPWTYKLFTIIELLQQLLILAAVVLFLMIAIYDSSDCLDCGKRESVTCWFIVILFFLAIILGALGLIIQTLKCLSGNEQEEEDIYRHTQYTLTDQQGQYTDSQYEVNKNVYNENVTIINKEQANQYVEENNMQDFMNRMEQDEEDISYVSGYQTHSYVDVNMQGRAPHELAPDSEDEKYNIDGVVRALNAEDSFNSEDLEESRLELDQQVSHLKANEQKFYDSVYKPSYENSFMTEKFENNKLNNLISNKHIQEETVIRNKKINRTSFTSDHQSY